MEAQAEESCHDRAAHASPKRQHSPKRLHGVTTQKVQPWLTILLAEA
jgi:hypothetical protein